MTRPPDDTEPGRRPLDYVLVVAASDWTKDRYPRAETNLTDALHADRDRHHDPEPEAEP